MHGAGTTPATAPNDLLSSTSEDLPSPKTLSTHIIQHLQLRDREVGARLLPVRTLLLDLDLFGEPGDGVSIALAHLLVRDTKPGFPKYPT